MYAHLQNHHSVCSYSPCPSAQRRCHFTTTFNSATDWGVQPVNDILSICYTRQRITPKYIRSDTKYEHKLTSLVFAKAWEGLVSPVKGLSTPLFTYATPSPLLPNSIIRLYYRAFSMDMALSYLVKVSWSHSGVRTPAARRSCLPCWLFLDPTLSVFRRKPR